MLPSPLTCCQSPPALLLQVDAESLACAPASRRLPMMLLQGWPVRAPKHVAITEWKIQTSKTVVLFSVVKRAACDVNIALAPFADLAASRSSSCSSAHIDAPPATAALKAMGAATCCPYPKCGTPACPKDTTA